MSWYENGLQFGCTGCGKCCTGSPGYVFLTEKDIDALCEKLSLARDEFLKKYCRQVGNSYSLLELRPHFDCIFLEKGEKCTVYDARPHQCRAFPFWPQNVENKEAWKAAGKECEGIDNPDGKHYSAEEIAQFFEV
ncbi:MAG: YkgJ family cysteine cluster protein [Simkaniaceae bacterium]|nr:YkgJ family cysteine cluster protein [Simkaniaceae bacterium]